ncbi:Uncharacterized protein TCM_014961 [Theobroma cacao]|uniref:Uncharacterized protein n=1 Tax=Theobroma cacao TaxID=3641 RepID=A0A061G146_THECC|nr:Uncharacterized protein TCM_014961 [Theobroma cacao]
MECIWSIKGWMTLQATETHNKRSMSPLSLVRRLRETSNKCCSFTPETGRRSDQVTCHSNYLNSQKVMLLVVCPTKSISRSSVFWTTKSLDQRVPVGFSCSKPIQC